MGGFLCEYVSGCRTDLKSKQRVQLNVCHTADAVRSEISTQ